MDKAIEDGMKKLNEAEDRKETDIEYGDDIPYRGEDVKYDTPEEGLEALLEDVRHFDIMLGSEFNGDAEDELRWIIDGISSGRYNVDEETINQLLEALEVRFEF